MKFNTITTIELSSECNLACEYCVNRFISESVGRKRGIMQDDIFERSLELLKELCRVGTQKEVNLNGNGESTLDPKLIGRINETKEIMGNRQVSFCTNGVNMTSELARHLKESKLDSITLSPHSPFHARRAAHIMVDNGIMPHVNFGAICATHNWAGQLEPENSVNCRLKNDCVPLEEGRGYISSEGWVSPCCYDYRLLGAFGHVFDDNILKRDVAPYLLCHACHQKISKRIQEQYNFIQ